MSSGSGQAEPDGVRERLARYFDTPLPSPPGAWRRGLMHGMIAALITVMAFVVNLLLVATTIEGIVFCVVCGLKTGLTYGISLYVVHEWLARMLPHGWGDFAERTVGREWIFGLTGFLLGFGLIIAGDQLSEPWLAELAGLDRHNPPSRNFTPLENLIRTVPFAMFIIFLVVHVRLNAQLRMEVERVAGLNRLLQDRHEAWERAGREQAGAGETRDGRGDLPKVVLSGGGITEALNPEAITHVTIEEHYARVHVREDGGFREIEVKMPLVRILDLLPPALFVQIHRSHVVNMGHVDKVERGGNGYQVALAKSATQLPISRNRVRPVLSRLQAWWEAEGSPQG